MQYNVNNKTCKILNMEHKIKELTKLLLQGSISKDDADKILLDLFSVSESFDNIEWIPLKEPNEIEKILMKLNEEAMPKLFRMCMIPKELVESKN